MNSVFKNIYPRQVWTNECFNQKTNCINNTTDERFGGFLIPFFAGAAISAPFWLAAGSNKNQQYYQYPPYPYYQSYPTYMNTYPIYNKN